MWCMEIIWFLTLLCMFRYAQLCLSIVMMSLDTTSLLEYRLSGLSNPLILQHGVGASGLRSNLLSTSLMEDVLCTCF
jgi:hypothetical protein